MSASKRGLCWPTDNTDPVFPFTKPGSKITWLYNWSPNATQGADSLEWVPMQWNHVNIHELAGKCQRDGKPAAKHFLAFNEPELPDQSNMPVELAAAAWLEHIEPLRRSGIRCGSPGISSAPQGVVWLRDFVARVRAGGSDVDFYALHWYGETLGQFYDYIWSTHHQLGADRPVWITEYACTNWRPEAPLPRDHVEGFVRDTVKYLDSLEWVERYAWFGAMRDCGTVGRWAAMLDERGALTEVGRIFRDE
ncbi:glycoside hydrolase family 128 protein [Polychaeton citri CBS 116435]|uniref:Glycoside hydrolase family 128 protein n=1 Tax=Polychaeton citri CBS 116435 TaxID=1314669 RepID=A0A9P4QF70_9PEZI|nr:glycoside hydrolase family 128 protein [Polychaeton citri CBS 116435]